MNLTAVALDRQFDRRDPGHPLIRLEPKRQPVQQVGKYAVRTLSRRQECQGARLEIRQPPGRRKNLFRVRHMQPAALAWLGRNRILERFEQVKVPRPAGKLPHRGRDDERPQVRPQPGFVHANDDAHRLRSPSNLDHAGERGASAPWWVTCQSAPQTRSSSAI